LGIRGRVATGLSLGDWILPSHVDVAIGEPNLALA